MRHPGPLFTLLAGLVLAAGIVLANVVNQGTQTTAPVSGTAVREPAATSNPTTANPAPPSTPQAEAPRRADFAGHVEGDAASIAVSVRDGDAIAYVCDGEAVEAWLHGEAIDGELRLTSADGGTLVGEFDAQSATGTVKTGGNTWRFTADAAQKPAGLYRANTTVQGSSARIGWIVQPDGSQVGLLSTGERTTAAPTLDTAAGTATVDGQQVNAESVSGRSGQGEF